MPFALTCPGCRAVLHVPEGLAGKTIRCTTCREALPVPAKVGGVPEPLPLDDDPPLLQAPPVARRPATASTPAVRRPARRTDDDDDDRPRKKKRKSGGNDNAIAFMVAGGLALLLLVGAGIYFATKGGKDKLAGGSGGTSSGGSAAGWIDVPSTAADGFTAKMPGVATTDLAAAGMAGMAAKGGHFYAHKVGKDYGYMAGYMELPAVVPAAMLPALFQSINDGMKKSAAGSGGGFFDRKVGVRFDGETPMDYEGFPGREYRLSAKPPDRGLAAFRVIVVHNRMYMAAAGVEPSEEDKLRQFFDSFKITFRPPAAPTPPPSTVAVNTTPATPDFAPSSPTPGNTAPPPFTPPLPPAFGGPGGNLNVVPVAQIDPFWAAAFAPGKNEVFTVGGRWLRAAGAQKAAGMLRRYSYPDFKLKGSYKLPHLASKAVYDEARGRLVLASLTRAEPMIRQNLAFDRTYGEGLLETFDLAPVLSGEIADGATLRATGIIPVLGKPVALALSGDGAGLYALVESYVVDPEPAYKGRLVQVDAEAKKTTRELALSEPIRDMCWSADGKQLLLTEWPVSGKNLPIPGKAAGLVAVDVAAWKKDHSLVLPGFTYDLTAAPSGRLVAVVGAEGGNKPFALDAGGGGAQEVVTGLGAPNLGYAKFAVGGKFLVVSSAGGSGGADVYEALDPAAGGFRRAATAVPAPTPGFTGYFHVSPDGAMAIFQTGAVMDVASAAAAP